MRNVFAFFLLLAACRTSSDAIGAGTSWTTCDDGYSARVERDGIGAGITHGSDNLGNRWRSESSPVTGDEHFERE